MTEVQIWLMFGVGRGAALARKLGVCQQTISANRFKSSDDVYMAMNKIEQSEMRLERCAKNNVLCAAKLVNHPSDLIRTKAQFALLTWAEIYAKLLRV